MELTADRFAVFANFNDPERRSALHKSSSSRGEARGLTVIVVGALLGMRFVPFCSASTAVIGYCWKASSALVRSV